jgi:hypothetical protein
MKRANVRKYQATELPLLSKFKFLEPKLTAKLFHLFNHFYQGIKVLVVVIFEVGILQGSLQDSAGANNS